MIKIITLASCLFAFALSTQAKEQPRYPVSAIPDELKKGAHAVVREDAMEFTIDSKSTASLKVHWVVTILNANAKRFATQAVWYDKLRKISSMKAQVLDADGQVIKRLKNNEITDHSAFEGMFSDNRMKVADLTQGRYPYTVEFEYEVTYKFLYAIDGSAINQYENVSVQHASYQLNFPEELAPRYKTHNISQEPTRTTTENGLTSLTWSFENLQAPTFEVYADRKKSIALIDVAPSVFEFEGYAGNMDTWDAYGRWIASLNRGRNVLPEETKNKIAELTADLRTREEKVKVLYEFMQNKTRYVSIQLGIGGYQPFEASLVDRTGYGDCKALSNYMIALLETVGIKSHYALIMAGENASPMEPDFPSSQFNHAIVAVPNGTDTLWLECTSQTNPFGYQGNHTGDRKALLITDDGASVVNTIHYSAEVNVQSTSADVHVAPTGEAQASVKRVYSGLQYENGNLNFYVTRQYDDQKKWLQSYIDIPSFDLTNFTIKNIKEKIPSAVITAELRMDRFATVSGKRIFLTPNLMNRNTFVPEKVENRKHEVIRKTAYTDLDTIRYHLPEGIYPEFLPEDVSIKSRFGEYEARFKVDQGSLVYIRRVKMQKGIFPASSYQELMDFYRNISKADNTKMVFMNKT